MKKLLYLCLLLMLSTPLIADLTQEAVFKLRDLKINQDSISGTLESDHPVVKKNVISMEVKMFVLVNGVKTDGDLFFWTMDNGVLKINDDVYLEDIEDLPKNAKVTYEFKVIGWHVVNKGKVKVIN